MNDNLFLISDFSVFTDVVAPLVGQIDAYRIPFLTFIFAIATVFMIFQIIKGNGQGQMVPLFGRLVVVCILLAAHKTIFSAMFSVTSEFGSLILPAHEYLEFLDTTNYKINSGFSLWGFIKSSISSIILILITIFHVVALKLFEIYRVFKLLFLYIIGPITLIVGVLPQRKENPFNYYMTVFETCLWKPVAAIIFKLLMLLNGHFSELSFANPDVDIDFSEISASVNFFTVISFSAITIIMTLKVPQITHWIVTKSSNAADDVMQASYKLIRDKTMLATGLSIAGAKIGMNAKGTANGIKEAAQGLSKTSNVAHFKKLAKNPMNGSFNKKLQNSKYDGLDFKKYHKSINYKDVENNIKNWTPQSKGK
jgi:hypothetical protein